MSSKKYFYIHNKETNLVITDLGFEDVVNYITIDLQLNMQAINIFEYGISETRGSGFRLDPKLSVNKRFTVKETKVYYE